MAKYILSYSITLNGVLEIEAESEDKAIALAYATSKNEDLIADASCVDDCNVEFNVEDVVDDN